MNREWLQRKSRRGCSSIPPWPAMSVAAFICLDSNKLSQSFNESFLSFVGLETLMIVVNPRDRYMGHVVL